MKTVQLSVQDMTCGGCSNSIQNALQAVDGVTSISVNLESRLVVIGFDEGVTTVDALLEAIDDAGFDAVMADY